MHTGNAWPIFSGTFTNSVHPRAYGERYFQLHPSKRHNGSSPCIRGTPTFTLINTTRSRFIPVHTGNANFILWSDKYLSVHPRAYGERLVVKGLGGCLSGSSPCIRGTHTNTRKYTARKRFIPVHTGNALAGAATGSVTAVHPRAYGERKVNTLSAACVYGSSPCIRGTQCHQI